MFNREQPVRVNSYFIVDWSPAGRSGAWLEDGIAKVTEFKPAWNIFSGLKSRAKRLSYSDRGHRLIRRRISNASRKKNRPR